MLLKLRWSNNKVSKLSVHRMQGVRMSLFFFWYQSGMDILMVICRSGYTPWYLGKISMVSIWFRMVLTQIITQIYKDSFDVPTKYQYLWYYHFDTHGYVLWCHFNDVDYWYHAFTYMYWSNIGRNFDEIVISKFKVQSSQTRRGCRALSFGDWGCSWTVISEEHHQDHISVDSINN